MEFKRCLRCGCFFVSANDVCCNCESKDRFDVAKLNNILEEDTNLTKSLGFLEKYNVGMVEQLNILNKYKKSNWRL